MDRLRRLNPQTQEDEGLAAALRRPRAASSGERRCPTLPSRRSALRPPHSPRRSSPRSYVSPSSPTAPTRDGPFRRRWPSSIGCSSIRRLVADLAPERLFAYEVTLPAMKHLRGLASPGDRIVFHRGGRVGPDRICAVRTPDGIVLVAGPLQGALAPPASRRGRAGLRRPWTSKAIEGSPRRRRRHARPASSVR